MKDLKQRTIRGGFARIFAQAANFSLRLISLMVLARMLGPKDFGLVGMVTAFTGVLNLFRDFGLSAASVQSATIDRDQSSTLFWINVLVGAILAAIAAAGAPAIAAFYHEPRLIGITVALSFAFLLNAIGVQHSALLQRQMRFTALAIIGIVSLAVGTGIGIVGAMLGFGYWSLVAMTVSMPLITTLGVWMSTAWLPGVPRSVKTIRPMMRFGSILTLNGLVAYAAYNFDKVLIGRFWGADAIGIYGRAYQLINIPTDNLNSAIGEVAFSALSRVQDDIVRLKSYFLKGYSLVVGMTLPITIACAIFADDLVAVLLGPKWSGAAVIFRLLAPTIAVFAIINPLGWLLNALGLVTRGLKIALAFAPTMIAGYFLGLRYGPKGVACAYSAVMILWVIPLTAWCIHGTGIELRDILLTVSRPLAAATLASSVALGVSISCGQMLPLVPRLILELTVLCIIYLGTLLLFPEQKLLYVNIFKELTAPSTTPNGS